MRTITYLAALAVVVPLVMSGCVVDDDYDDVDYVPAPSSSTTIIDDDKPDVHVTPSAPTIIERSSPPPDVKIDVNNPPIEIKTERETRTTGGF